MQAIKEKKEIETRFKDRGVGAKYKQQSISTLYSTEVDEILRSLPNRSEYIRQAVMNRLKADGLL